MKAIELQAKWDPAPDFELGAKDTEGKLVSVQPKWHKCNLEMA